MREMHGAGKSSDLHGITKRNTKPGLEIGNKRFDAFPNLGVLKR